MTTTEPAAGIGRYQLAALLGVSETAMDRAHELMLLPPAAGDGRWPPAVVDDLRARWPQIAEAIQQAQELGAARCAEMLTRATDLPVTAADITELGQRGMLPVSRVFRQRPLYRVADVQALADDPRMWEQIATLVAARQNQRRGPGQQQ